MLCCRCWNDLVVVIVMGLTSDSRRASYIKSPRKADRAKGIRTNPSGYRSSAGATRCMETKTETAGVPGRSTGRGREEARDGTALAQAGTSKVKVHDGPPDLTPHRIAMVQHLWSRPNPHGEGVIVTASQDGKNDSANRTRSRAVWLVLGGTIYPLNVNAARAFGILQDVLPPQIATKAGLPSGGTSTEKSLGIEDYILFRWHGAENPLPYCP